MDLTTTMSMAARAVRVAREVGAAQQEADASITLGIVRIYCDASIEGVDDLRAGLALALDIDAPLGALRGYVNLSDALEFLGRHDEAVEAARQGSRWPAASGWPGPWAPS